jgi:hypothetical protein
VTALDPRHALYVGWVLGVALTSGVKAAPIYDGDGDYTDRLTITFERSPHRAWTVDVTVVVPPPPDGWQLTDVVLPPPDDEEL